MRIHVQRLAVMLALAPFPISACVNGVDDDLGQVMSAGDVGDEQGLTTQCAAGPTVRGIDVSYYQGTIDWHRVAADNVHYAIIRVSDGRGYVDPRFEQNWANAKKAGVMRGAYQFFEANQDPIAQANLLLSHMGPLSPGDLPPMLDVEYGGDDGEPPHVIAERARAWVKHVEDKLHVKPIIYTGPYHWEDEVGSANFTDLPLFVAHYGTQCPLVPRPWPRWTFHQYESTGHVAGIVGNVDMDDFNGTLAQLHAVGVGEEGPHACVTGHYNGAFCDDDGKYGEPEHNALKNALDVDFHCASIAGSPAFCGSKTATRAQAAYVLGKAAHIPTNGKPDAFVDDENNGYETYLDAMHAYGVVIGYADGRNKLDAKPSDAITRNQLAHWLKRMYALPPADHDYFDDDDGSVDEDVHNRVAAAGLMIGMSENGKRVFRGTDDANRSALAVVAVRAHEHHLKAVWAQ